MKKEKKKSSISKINRGGGSGKNRNIGTTVPGTGKEFIREYPGQDPSQIIIPKKKKDPEKITSPVIDSASDHKFPPTKNDPIFRKVWAQFIDSISKRENFSIGHLNTLEILCDLYVEYEELRAFIRVNGRSYKVYGRQGMIWKFFPEVAQLKSVQHQISIYMKQLGLVLKKDTTGESGGEKDNWA